MERSAFKYFKHITIYLMINVKSIWLICKFAVGYHSMLAMYVNRAYPCMQQAVLAVSELDLSAECFSSWMDGRRRGEGGGGVWLGGSARVRYILPI